MKKYLFGIIVVLWLSAVACMSYSYFGKDESVIVTAFNNAEFIETESTVSAISEVGDTYMSSTAKRKLVVHIAESLGIEAPYNYSEENEENETRAVLKKSAKSASTEICLESIESVNSDGSIKLEQNLMVIRQLWRILLRFFCLMKCSKEDVVEEIVAYFRNNYDKLKDFIEHLRQRIYNVGVSVEVDMNLN